MCKTDITVVCNKELNKMQNPKSIQSRDNHKFQIMERLKIVENFLNSLESEQMQEGQDVVLFNGTPGDQLAGLGTNVSACINSSGCDGSINNRRCSNGSCDSSINGRKCTNITTTPPPLTKEPETTM